MVRGSHVYQDKATIDRIYEPIQEQLGQVEERLQSLVPEGHAALSDLLRHVTSSSGKRVRPAITLLASRFHPNSGELPVTVAAAIELLHLASLVHDDTVDNSSMRRGMATVSSLWGRNVAVQLGDYVFATSAVFVCDTKNVRVIRRFSETIKDLATGELVEAFGTFQWNQTYEQYKDRIFHKTASLFRAAAESGAVLSGASETTIQALCQYGYSLGMAFQIVDDILDFDGTQEEVGKPVGHDLLQGVLTLPAMLFLERYPANNPIIPLFRGEDPEGNRQKVLEIVRNSTIIQDAYAVAEGFSADAAEALESLPDIRERQSLLDLASYVVERRR